MLELVTPFGGEVRMRHGVVVGAVAMAVAFYQLVSARMDWGVWLALRDQRIFPFESGRWSVLVSIPTHYIIGLLLVAGIDRAQRDSQRSTGVQPRGHAAACAD